MADNVDQARDLLRQLIVKIEGLNDVMIPAMALMPLATQALKLLEQSDVPLKPFVPALQWQRDPRWLKAHLGLPSAGADSTIGDYGCVITCLAMLANVPIGKNTVTPLDMNAALVTINGFASGNLIMWSRVPLAFPALKFFDFYTTPKPLIDVDFARIDSRLVKGIPVIVCVDFSPKAGVQTHYVLIVSWIGELKEHHYVIHDPWFNETAPLNKRYPITSGVQKDASHAIEKYAIFDCEPAMLKA